MICASVVQHLLVILYLKYNVFMGGVLKKDQLLQMYLAEGEKLLNNMRSCSEIY